MKFIIKSEKFMGIKKNVEVVFFSAVTVVGVGLQWQRSSSPNWACLPRDLVDLILNKLILFF